MSIVGPRPHPLALNELFAEHISPWRRHAIKPGITGWAQVNGLRGQTSIADRVEGDNYYIRNWSLGFALKIMMLTTEEILRLRDSQKARKRAAEAAHVDVRFYNIIYNLIDDIKAAMAGMLEPTYKDQTEGFAQVREVFRLPRNEQAAGLIVTDGKITRTGTVRVLRNGAVVHEGTVRALKRFKDDVRDVAAGYECGLSLENFNDFQVGDNLEFYHKERVS